MTPEIFKWIKGIFFMLSIGVVALLVTMAKVSEIRNLMKGKGGHL